MFKENVAGIGHIVLDKIFNFRDKDSVFSGDSSVLTKGLDTRNQFSSGADFYTNVTAVMSQRLIICVRNLGFSQNL